MRPAIRAKIEEAIELLIGLLDTVDGDPDLEPGAEDEGHDSDSEPEYG